MEYYVANYGYINVTKNEQLVIELPSNLEFEYGKIINVRIEYSVSKDATAISWVPSEQTFGKDHMFLYTQCEAIHCRSIAPLQDSPAIKSTFDATIRVAKPYVPIVSGLLVNKTTEGDIEVYKYEQRIPVPSYLLALVAGNLTYEKIGPRTGVFAEPAIVKEAAEELSEMDAFLNIVMLKLMCR